MLPEVSNRARNIIDSGRYRPLASDVEICNSVNSKYEISPKFVGFVGL